jgi:hypothetical protein
MLWLPGSRAAWTLRRARRPRAGFFLLARVRLRRSTGGRRSLRDDDGLICCSLLGVCRALLRGWCDARMRQQNGRNSAKQNRLGRPHAARLLVSGMPAAQQPAWSDANLKAHDVAAVARLGLACGEIVRGQR